MIILTRHFRFTSMLIKLRVIAAALALLALPALAMSGRPADQRDSPDSGEPDAMLFKTLTEIRDNHLDVALVEVDKVLKQYPTFRLAHLIRGDLLTARAGPLHALGGASNGPQDRIADLRDEARVRLARYQALRPTDRVPKYVLQLSSEQKYVLVVDTQRSTLYAFENRDGALHYVADYYVTSGKNGSDKMRAGDKKTPLGVYHVTANLPRATLGALYGAGAFPISYPNELDHREGREGCGIWLHGTPADTYSRPPRASDGCVVLTNHDLETVAKNLNIGVTPVIISNGIEWVKPDQIDGLRRDLVKSVESWRRAWESRDVAAYLKYYDAKFSTGSMQIGAWSEQKRRTSEGKTWIKVGLQHMSLFLYPGRDDLAVVNFDQDYSSNNLSNKMRKRQYWINDKGGWHILYEGAA